MPLSEAARRPVRPRTRPFWPGSQTYPLADPKHSAELVSDALANFDQQALKVGEHLKVLKAFLPIVDDLSTQLRHKIRNHALPLSNPGNETAALIRDLHRQMAIGYERTLTTHDTSGLLGTLSKRDLLSALQGAMVYLAELLFDYFQVYQQPEAGIWQDLHQLYHYAERHQQLNAPLASMATPAGSESSLKRLYLRLLLLTLASPYRMRQGELEWVYSGLQRWIAHCDISTPPIHDTGLGVLTIDMSADEPAYQPAPGQPIGPERYRILTTIDLLPVLRQELNQIHENGTVEQTSDGGALSPDIYKRLTQAWSMTPQRSFSRSERTSELQVTIGLGPIHHFVESGDTDNLDDAPLDLVPDDHPRGRGEYVVENHTQDIWSLAYTHDLDQDPTRAPEAHICGTINESAGGYCLTTRRESNLRARVGELIGIHINESNNPWEIGVIRWLRGGDKDWMEFGVQMIAPYARAVQIVVADDREDAETRHPALLLPEVRAMRQPVGLVTESSTYPVGSTLTMITAKGNVDITVSRLLEATGSYSLYQFSSHIGVMEWLDI